MNIEINQVREKWQSQINFLYDINHQPMKTNVSNIPISQLKPNKGQIAGLPKNPVFIRDYRFNALVKSISDNPEMLELRELIVFPQNGDFIVICGNQRLMAMRDLKFKEAPCKVLSETTTIEKLRAYIIKDNVAFGEPDWEALANDWTPEELHDYGMEIKDYDYKQDNEFSDNNDMLEDQKMIVITGEIESNHIEEIQELCKKNNLKCRIRN